MFFKVYIFIGPYLDELIVITNDVKVRTCETRVLVVLPIVAESESPWQWESVSQEEVQFVVFPLTMNFIRYLLQDIDIDSFINMVTFYRPLSYLWYEGS